MEIFLGNQKKIEGKKNHPRNDPNISVPKKMGTLVNVYIY